MYKIRIGKMKDLKFNIIMFGAVFGLMAIFGIVLGTPWQEWLK